MSTSSLFDREVALPDEALLGQEGQLLGFQERYSRMAGQLRLLMHADELESWSRSYHKQLTQICKFVGEQYPLILFHGDVGTGKTVTAECLANRLVADDPKATDSLLFKLSTRVRGSGKVGEMGSLINEAFHQLVTSAGKGRRAFLIIDEGDSLAAARSQDQSHHEDKVAVNTVIQNVDDLRQHRGRILVIFCTNRLRAMDAAILRRAAIIEEFARPTDAERFELFRNDLGDLQIPEKELAELVDATRPKGEPPIAWTYSDIRTRLYPNAVAKAFPKQPLKLSHLIDAARELKPSPAIEDL